MAYYKDSFTFYSNILLHRKVEFKASYRLVCFLNGASSFSQISCFGCTHISKSCDSVAEVVFLMIQEAARFVLNELSTRLMLQKQKY
jgi:hypothetical protein